MIKLGGAVAVYYIKIIMPSSSSSSSSDSSSEDSLPPATITVSNLTSNVTEEHLREIFGNFGEIRSLGIRPQAQNSYALINFEVRAHAEQAITSMHMGQLDGLKLDVRFDATSPTPAAKDTKNHDNTPRQPEQQSRNNPRDKAPPARERKEEKERDRRRSKSRDRKGDRDREAKERERERERTKEKERERLKEKEKEKEK